MNKSQVLGKPKKFITLITKKNLSKQSYFIEDVNMFIYFSINVLMFNFELCIYFISFESLLNGLHRERKKVKKCLIYFKIKFLTMTLKNGIINK